MDSEIVGGGEGETMGRLLSLDCFHLTAFIGLLSLDFLTIKAFLHENKLTQ